MCLRHAALPLVLALSGCTASINQASFFPQALAAPEGALAAPAGYRLEDAMVELPGLGVVHAVRLDSPTSDKITLYDQ